MEKEIIKHYTNGELTIVWKPAACTHSRNCWNAVTGMPSVFDPRVRPWINMANGDTERMRQQVARCPSGALSTFFNNDTNEPKPVSEDSIKVKVLPDGPLLVQGEIDVEGADGQVLRKSSPTAFCRCGFSLNKPYCDGSHVSQGFKG